LFASELADCWSHPLDSTTFVHRDISGAPPLSSSALAGSACGLNAVELQPEVVIEGDTEHTSKKIAYMRPNSRKVPLWNPILRIREVFKDSFERCRQICSKSAPSGLVR
jgi:hypothetical protein